MKHEEILSKIIQKETVSHVGQTDLTKFLEMHELLKELFPKLFAASEYKNINGSMLLKWPGKNKEKKPLLFMNHMDVVEAIGPWKYPAFSGAIAEGKVWGRGTQDTKGGLFVMLQAAEELAAEGFVPEQDIYFESACNEEVTGEGASQIAEILEAEGIEFEYVLDEGGKIMNENGELTAQLGVSEKAVVELEFVATSSGGHASRPPKNTPLVRLGRFMAAYDDAELFTEKFYEETGESEKTTVAFTMAAGSNARNVIPTKASVICSMRCSHHQSTDECIKIMTDFAQKFDVETNVLYHGLESPLSTTKSGKAEGKPTPYDKIVDCIKLICPDAKIAAFMMAGATDSHYFGKVSKNIYKFTPMVITPDQEDTVHSLNENVDISSLGPSIAAFKYLYTH